MPIFLTGYIRSEVGNLSIGIGKLSSLIVGEIIVFSYSVV